MINSMVSWAENIIVSIIVVTILEMILPDGNSKKYIKAVIGVYIVFVIISPIVGKNFLKEFNVDEFLKQNEKEQQVLSKNIEINNEKYINNVYKEKLKEDIEIRIKELGYTVNEIAIEIDENSEIEKITLKNIGKDNHISPIQNIQINISNTVGGSTACTLDESEIEEIKNHLNKTYEINKDNIIIS